MLLRVQLVRPFAGQPAGTVLSLRTDVAQRLLERRQAVVVRTDPHEQAVTGPSETAEGRCRF